MSKLVSIGTAQRLKAERDQLRERANTHRKEVERLRAAIEKHKRANVEPRFADSELYRAARQRPG